MSRETGQSSFGFHRLKSFMRCPQAFAYHEILRLVPRIENEYSGRGTVLHEALRAHALGRDPEVLVQNLPSRYAPHIAEGMRLFRAYLEHWGHEQQAVLDVEREFEVSIGGYPFTRRIDNVHERDGSVWGMDHKTATRPGARGATAPEDWSLATQELVLKALSEQLYGKPYGGFILDLVGSGSEATFERQQIAFKPRMMEAIPRSLLHVYEAIERLEGTDPWLYPRSGACREGYKCDHLPLCNNGRAWLRQYEVEG